jgi:uncharacterized protein YkwD
MARTHDFEHQSLDPLLDCVNVHAAGENIAFGYETPRQLVSGWMHSPGHRANILNRHFHRIGISGWRDTGGHTYATQDSAAQVSSRVFRRRRTTSRPIAPITSR